MVSESDIQHLTEYDLDEGTESYEEDASGDEVGFDLFYDGSTVNPWEKGPHEVVRLYFNDDRLDDYYVPITYAQRIEEGIRSTPIGEPIGDGAENPFEDGDVTTRIEEGATIDGAEFDLLWYSNGEDEAERVIVAADFGHSDE